MTEVTTTDPNQLYRIGIDVGEPIRTHPAGLRLALCAQGEGPHDCRRERRHCRGRSPVRRKAA